MLPYKFEDVSLPDVVRVYKPLADAGRLVIPAQAAREFAKHRSSKVADLVKWLREQAGLSGPVLKKKIGALTGHAGFDAARKKAGEVAARIKEVQAAINDVADEIAADVGEDPVSVAYRQLFPGAVRDDPQDCVDEAAFKAELKTRYEMRRPPGYKDGSKDDAGAGDLIIWKTILAEGAARNADCIFVTGEEKPDWHVQSNGPFQPRLELLEEYRVTTGHTLHIIPLSRLLRLFEASQQVVEEVKQVEATAGLVRLADAISRSHQKRHEEWRVLEAEIDRLDRRIAEADRHLEGLPPPDGNMSLPWNRSYAVTARQRIEADEQRAALLSRLAALRSDEVR